MLHARGTQYCLLACHNKGYGSSGITCNLQGAKLTQVATIRVRLAPHRSPLASSLTTLPQAGPGHAGGQHEHCTVVTTIKSNHAITSTNVNTNQQPTQASTGSCHKGLQTHAPTMQFTMLDAACQTGANQHIARARARRIVITPASPVTLSATLPTHVTSVSHTWYIWLLPSGQTRGCRIGPGAGQVW